MKYTLTFPTVEEMATMLYAAGWESSCDAQWEKLEGVMRDVRVIIEASAKTQLDVEIQAKLTAERELYDAVNSVAALREDKALLDAFDLAGRKDDVQAHQISEDECEQELIGHFWQTPTVQSYSCREAIRAAIGTTS